MEWGCQLVIGESDELTQRSPGSPIASPLKGKGKRPDIEVRARVVDPMVA